MESIVLFYYVASLAIIIAQPSLPSLKLNAVPGITIMALLAAVPVGLLYYKHKLNPTDSFKLAAVRLAHYMSFFTSMLYIFIFAHKYDAVYLSFIVILYFHWLLIKGECIFTYLEQKFMDPTYVMGSNIYNHPWLQMLIGEYTNPLLVISYILIVLNVSIVTKRYFTSQVVFYIVIFGMLALGLKSNIERYQRSSSVTSIGMS